MAKMVSGRYIFYSDEIETIDARDWPVDVLVMVKGHCGPLDTHPVWITRKDAASLLFPEEEDRVLELNRRYTDGGSTHGGDA